jgi:hypothetical protein
MPRLAWPAEKLRVARYPAAYHSDLEVTLALGWGVRLGLNPGEALDFLLGWCFVDLYDDDQAPAAAAWRPAWLDEPFRPRPQSP